MSVAPAEAANTSPTINDCFNTSGIPCYARGTFHNGDGYGGGYVQVEGEDTTASGNAWVNETLWVTTNGTSENYWGEIGYSDNNLLCRGARRWYITYVNPSSQAQKCISGSVTAGTWYQLEVQQTSSSAYGIYLNNNLVENDKGAAESSYYAYAGSEYHLTPVATNKDVYFSYNEVRAKSCCSWSYWPTGGSNVSYSSDLNWHWTTDWIHGYDSGSD